MKRKFNYCLLLITVLFFSANVSQAAFVVKKQSKQVVAQSAAQPENYAIAAPMANVENITAATAVKTKIEGKHNFFSRIFGKVLSGTAAMPQILYIILAIFGLGWLGMGINDNFSDYDWLISLVLYILFYIPGLIYTLIKMSKYY